MEHAASNSSFAKSAQLRITFMIWVAFRGIWLNAFFKSFGLAPFVGRVYRHK